MQTCRKSSQLFYRKGKAIPAVAACLFNPAHTLVSTFVFCIKIKKVHYFYFTA